MQRWDARSARRSSGAPQGMISTPPALSGEARGYAASVSPGVVLVDSEGLAALTIGHNVGVGARKTYALKRADGDNLGKET